MPQAMVSSFNGLNTDAVESICEQTTRADPSGRDDADPRMLGVAADASTLLLSEGTIRRIFGLPSPLVPTQDRQSEAAMKECFEAYSFFLEHTKGQEESL